MTREERGVVGFGCFVFAALTLFAAGVFWYRAKIQRDVYERQGVHMTTWEVFCGAKPVERYVKP
jgi:hypothetical protein